MPSSSDVERVGIGVRRDPPGDRRQAQDETGRDRDHDPARQLATRTTVTAAAPAT